jgi:hypothetical protein
MQCNKIKSLKIKDSDIVDALKTSEAIEVSADKKKVRRVGNKPIPELNKSKNDGLKKREAKAASKEEEKHEEQEAQLDERGNPILVN